MNLEKHLSEWHKRIAERERCVRRREERTKTCKECEEFWEERLASREKSLVENLGEREKRVKEGEISLSNGKENLLYEEKSLEERKEDLNIKETLFGFWKGCLESRAKNLVVQEERRAFMVLSYHVVNALAHQVGARNLDNLSQALHEFTENFDEGGYFETSFVDLKIKIGKTLKNCPTAREWNIDLFALAYTIASCVKKGSP